MRSQQIYDSINLCLMSAGVGALVVLVNGGALSVSDGRLGVSMTYSKEGNEFEFTPDGSTLQHSASGAYIDLCGSCGRELVLSTTKPENGLDCTVSADSHFPSARLLALNLTDSSETPCTSLSEDDGDNGDECATVRLGPGPTASLTLISASVIAEPIDSFAASGYAVVKVLTEDAAVSANNTLAEVEERLASESEPNGDVKVDEHQIRVGDILLQHPLFVDLLLWPPLMMIVRSVLAADCRLATWSSNTLYSKEEGAASALGWHCDYPYHDISQPWPDVPLGLQALWALDDFSPQSGGTMFKPDSHHLLREPPYNFDHYDDEQVLTAPKGSVLIAHAAWWHRQTVNSSDKPRRALLANFIRNFVIPKDDMQLQHERLTRSQGFAERAEWEKAALDTLLLGSHKRGLRGSVGSVGFLEKGYEYVVC